MLLTAGLVLIIGSLQIHGAFITNNKAEIPPVKYILPDDINPLTYNVFIDVIKSLTNATGPQTFDGFVTIDVQTKNVLKNITLHAANITVLNIDVLKDSKNIYLEDSRKYNQANDSLFFKLTEEVQRGIRLTININYTALLHTDMHGFYVSSYVEDKKTKTVLTTQFQPTHARRAFPCFDEPKYKATFLINVAKPENYTVISNMLPLSNSTETIVRFAETNKMSTYLVAFIVSEFNQRPGNETHYNVWARPDADNQTIEAAKAMKPIIDDLDEFTGIKYSEYMNKMDMVALPDFSAGAMENWGCLTFRETALLVDDKLSTNQDLQRVITVIAHEIAHQWFGNLVTLTWWDNTWLNEGFARYFEYHTTAAYKPEWEMEHQFVVEQHQSIFEVDALEKTTPLTHNVQTAGEISSHFGTISYSKGGSIVRMMEKFLTLDVFKAGLQSYLKMNSFQNTQPQNLWFSLEEESSKGTLQKDYTIDRIMTNWISKPGFPLVTVNVTKDGLALFSQKRFFSNPKANETTPQHWYIPISYKTAAETNFSDTTPQFWLTPNEPSKWVDIKNNTWVIVNTMQAGYYRVNYNQEHWNVLAKALNVTDTREKIHKINRAQLIDDAMNLAKAGIIPYGTAFNVTDYLLTEKDYFPWYSAFRAFRFLLQRYAEESETGQIVRTYMKIITKALVEGKDFSDPAKPETHLEVLNKVQALDWACNLGVDECVLDAVKQFKNIDSIPKNVRSIVYCTAIKNGTEDMWEQLWEKYVNSNVAAEKVGIINALGCSTNSTILNNFLNKSIEGDEIRSQDAAYVFSAVYTGTSEGVTIALDFLEKNAQAIIHKYGGMNALDKAVLGIAGRLTTKEDLKKLEKALTNPIFDTIREAGFETVRENVAWADLYGGEIGTYLKDRFNSAGHLMISRMLMFFSLGFISIYLTKFA